MEEEAREYVNSVHIEDDPVDKYSIPEQQEEEETEPEPEVVVEETPAEEIPASFPTDVNTVQAPPLSAVEEPVGEPQKKTYASIVCTALPSFFLYICMLGCLCMHTLLYAFFTSSN